MVVVRNCLFIARLGFSELVYCAVSSGLSSSLFVQNRRKPHHAKGRTRRSARRAAQKNHQNPSSTNTKRLWALSALKIKKRRRGLPRKCSRRAAARLISVCARNTMCCASASLCWLVQVRNFISPYFCLSDSVCLPFGCWHFRSSCY